MFFLCVVGSSGCVLVRDASKPEQAGHRYDRWRKVSDVWLSNFHNKNIAENIKPVTCSSQPLTVDGVSLFLCFETLFKNGFVLWPHVIRLELFCVLLHTCHYFDYCVVVLHTHNHVFQVYIHLTAGSQMCLHSMCDTLRPGGHAVIVSYRYCFSVAHTVFGFL